MIPGLRSPKASQVWQAGQRQEHDSYTTMGIGESATGLPKPLFQGKNSTAAVGPEVTLSLATKRAVFVFFTFRYHWEFLPHTTTQGHGMNMQLIFPLKPIKIM